jgi:hypothetical protein
MSKVVAGEFKLSDCDPSTIDTLGLLHAAAMLGHETRKLLDKYGLPDSLELVRRGEDINPAMYSPTIAMTRDKESGDYSATVILSGTAEAATFTGLSYDYSRQEDATRITEADTFFIGQEVPVGDSELPTIEEVTVQEVIGRTARALGALTDISQEPPIPLADYQWLMRPREM